MAQGSRAILLVSVESLEVLKRSGFRQWFLCCSKFSMNMCRYKCIKTTTLCVSGKINVLFYIFLFFYLGICPLKRRRVCNATFHCLRPCLETLGHYHSLQITIFTIIKFVGTMVCIFYGGIIYIYDGLNTSWWLRWLSPSWSNRWSISVNQRSVEYHQ